MAVRNTESRIPGGFTQQNADKLGQAVVSGNHAIISYLESPLRHGSSGLVTKYIKNTYVAFSNAGALGANTPDRYSWSVYFFEGNETTHFYHLQEEREAQLGGAVFQLDTEDPVLQNFLNGKNLTKIIIELNVSTVTAPIAMEQLVTGLYVDIEDLISQVGKSTQTGAVAGDPDITRLAVNDFRNLLVSFDKFIRAQNPAVAVPANVVAALFYGATQRRSIAGGILFNWFRWRDEDVWMKYLNTHNEPVLLELMGSRLGLLDLKPHIIHFFMTNQTGIVNLPAGIEYNPETQSLEAYEKNILRLFHETAPIDAKIDLFNQLRFPKSCISLAWNFITQLKDRHAEWKETQFNKTTHKDNKKSIETVISELETAPQKQIQDTSDIATTVYGNMYSPLIEKIFKLSIVDYEIIRIQVLDIRSGRPIANANVKKLVIGSGDSEIVSDFESTDKSGKHGWKTINADNIPLQAQHALRYLGYDPGDPLTKVYGETGKAAYNEYWRQRNLLKPDGPVDEIAEKGDKNDQPPIELLEEIVQEYHHHSMTNRQGVLLLRVPKSLLNNRKLHIDLGFMEFAYATEAVLEDNRVNPILRINADKGLTGFNVAWIGKANAEAQNRDWGDNVKGGKDFGWEVRSVGKSTRLKVASRLPVKEDENTFFTLNKKLLSALFDPVTNPYHFVLFGMQWCQPVWDDFNDPVIPSQQHDRHVYINHNVYANDSNYSLLTISGYTDNAVHTIVGNNMHIVTTVNMNTFEPLKQKGYGVYDIRNIANSARGDEHFGHDIYNQQDHPVFAIRKAIATPRTNNGGVTKGFGYYTRLELTTNEHIDLAHFREVDPRPIHITNAVNGISVLPGEIIGYAGRTGNIEDFSPQHTHIRYRHSGDQKTMLNMPDSNDPNRNILPQPELPLLFPCRADYRDKDPTNCEFNNNIVTRNGSKTIQLCFAPLELCCPHMNVARNDPRFPQKLQAQLSFLARINKDQYIDPGPIDGDLGAPLVEPSPGSQSLKISKSQFAIRKFREANSFSKSFTEDYKLDGDDLALLNSLVSPDDAFNHTNVPSSERQNANKLLQSQLKYLFDNNNAGGKYRDPGPIDGDIGVQPLELSPSPTVIAVSKTRYAIRGFRVAHALSNVFNVDYEIPGTPQSPELAKLDQIAPIIKKQE